MTRFLVESWKEEEVRPSLGEITLILTLAEQCSEFTMDDIKDVPELTSSHEEADARLALHAKQSM